MIEYILYRNKASLLYVSSCGSWDDEPLDMPFPGYIDMALILRECSCYISVRIS